MTVSVRLEEFDLWRPGYGFAEVTVLVGGTTTPAAIFTDEALTLAAANPQTLLQMTLGSISYGKWAQPLYTGQPYQLQINSVDETGIVGVPLQTLVGVDASLATVLPAGAVVAGNLDDILARTVNILDYGAFIAVGQPSASATTNTTTLAAAIAKASANGGGEVELPAGLFAIVSLTVPENVVLRGQGTQVTFLQSLAAVTPVITIGGFNAGLRQLCLNGVNQVGGSIGFYALLQQGTVLEDVLVENFATGIEEIGGSGRSWRNLSVSNCLTGYAGYGSSNSQSGGPGGGGPLEFNSWAGGIVNFCSTAGILIESIDELCDHNSFSDMQFDSNTGIAFQVAGARASLLKSCSWNGNTTDLAVADGSPINATLTNTVIGFECDDASFVGTGSNGGAITLANTLKDVAFRRCEFTKETITLNAPQNNVVFQDCRQISGVTFAGAATAVISSSSYYEGKTVGLTTNNSGTAAWNLQLQSGQIALLEVSIVGRCRNEADSASNPKFYAHKFIQVAECACASITYQSETTAFAAGNVLTGATSGATARIVSITTSGTSGTLYLMDIEDTFQNGEIITDSQGGSADANSAVAPGTTALSANTSIYGPVKTDSAWTDNVTAAGQDVVVYVQGDTAMNVEWSVNVNVLLTETIE